jgi:hypothetical protein
MKNFLLTLGTILITLLGISLLFVVGPIVLGGSYMKDWVPKRGN